jgi:FdhD protein
MTRLTPILRHTANASHETQDTLAIEEPLQIWINGKPFATLMRSPGDDAALATGFLFSEGILTDASQILSLAPTGHPTSQELHLQLATTAQMPPRSLNVSSSCGVCGRSTIAGLLDKLPPLSPFPFPPQALYPLPERLSHAQRHFASTGGLHAAALFDEQFALLAIAEDVGRHNALDKLIGARLLAHQPLPPRCLLLMSSRASFDILQKALLAGIPAVATLGASSSLAVDLARSAGIRLFSFLRSSSVVELSPARTATQPSTPAPAPEPHSAH